ncbi:AMP-binding protein [Paracoccus sp. MC1862]|uniref:AMP-binding protein n=1 Tax=Paracoccus sp. MC1862 TaxID=2760307 RepID=UPI001600853D|nr:AMP-binding protein [Paracoccus sp. MC1862]MBB1499323.1 AMP-binding protein [Paracoccus sp. MC1862]QQO46631.1 AMP-binding protein [Paracoccus sp. MC1862]
MTPVWVPDPARIESAALSRLLRHSGRQDFDALRDFALADMEGYWRHVVADLGLRFRRPFRQVMDLRGGVEWARWFEGGALNFTDILLAPEGAKDGDLALVELSESGARRDITRAELCREVEAAMSRLASLGVGKGDRVAMLLPNIAEAAVVMVATARIGAIIVPLYSAFGPEAIATRINAAGARVLISCDGWVRGGKTIRTVGTLAAIAVACPGLETVAVFDSLGEGAPEGTCDWASLPGDRVVEAPALDPNTPWMIMFTSGTTGMPKGTVHIHGGFPFRVAHDTAYQVDFRPGDRLMWYSDMGWMVGPWQICAPLMLGGSLVLYNGGPTSPDALELLRVAKAADVSHFGTAPTMLRVMRAAVSELPAELGGNFRTIITAGEVIDEPTFLWAFQQIGHQRTPIINLTGGTEISGGILSNIVLRPIYPVGFNSVVTDVDAAVVYDGNETAPGEVGELVLRRPMVGLTVGLWQDSNRFIESYWSQRPGLWSHGDLVVRHANGVWELRGRSDDVLKISGRRVGPSEIEEAALSDSRVVAAAAIGVPDAKSGQAVVLLVVPRPEVPDDGTMAEALREHVARKLGAGLRPREVLIVPELPRTRNGKILRRLARQVVLGEPLGDLTTLENPASLESLRAATEAARLGP